MKNFKKKSAFTLLEIIIAIVVLTLAIGGIYKMSIESKRVMTKSEYSITAMYLAQEGLEAIKTIRNERFFKSFNKEEGWGKFLTDDLGYGGMGSGGTLFKKLKFENKKFKLENAGVSFDKSISSVDDICLDVGKYEDCIYEHINIKNIGDKKNGNLGKNFFRRIKIKKDFGETNLVMVFSEVFWEDNGKLEKFSVKQNFGNILIN
ncbi:type II secretion system GspH family protein [Candidatus Gracilibacteria bacterium]|nr:type II secretion system GspH family protein [Candidatus Gracilibacteria bacterium]